MPINVGLGTSVFSVSTILGTVTVTGTVSGGGSGGGGVQYVVGSTDIGATGTGTLFIGVQQGATTAKTLAITTSGGISFIGALSTITSTIVTTGSVSIINTPVVTATISNPLLTVTGTVTSIPSGTQNVNVTNVLSATNITVASITTGTVAVSNAPIYSVGLTSMGATATGYVSLGVQSGATTGRALLLTTTGGLAHLGLLTTGTVNVVNVLSASGITVASITTGTMSVVNVLSASGVTIASITTGTMTVIGGVATGVALAQNPVPIAGRSLTGAAGIPFINDIGGSIYLLGVQPIDGGLNFIDYNTDGSTPITGNILHDAVDSANYGPVKVGAFAVDYLPSTSGERGAGAVAASDRVNLVTNLRGELIESVKAEYVPLTQLNTVYSTSVAITSTAVVCWQYRHAGFHYTLTKTNSPTDILFEIWASYDGTNYNAMKKDFLGDLRESNSSIGTGTGKSYQLDFPIACQKLYVKAIPTCTGTNTITGANMAIYLRN